ncbi:phage tail fiber protein [Acinetobacter brisouii]|uniref:phage tail fiber protein n=1 Tax=Acinetobacter brisouii TaxID=396323 RepID=UPI00124F7CF4|nr:phage tail protein [Acinetobacter brisouii]
MTKQTINVGNAANDGTGDPARTAFTKANQNFKELYDYLGDGITLNRLGSSAFANIGLDLGDILGVGSFGLGASGGSIFANNFSELKAALNTKTQFFRNDGSYEQIDTYSPSLYVKTADTQFILSVKYDTGNPTILSWVDNFSSPTVVRFRTDKNTTVDANGFIKAASPIVKLFADKIELNDEASEQNITFEKVDVGHYLIKGSSGLAKEGWTVEQPRDANGNLYHVVEYTTLEGGDIEIKTFDYMLDKKGRIVADYNTALDVQENRWIDLRLQEIEKSVKTLESMVIKDDFTK